MVPHEFHEQAEVFLSRVFSQLDAQKINLKPYWSIDHICYRADTIETYQSLRSEFECLGDLLTESQVNGRPITTFKLLEPLTFRGRRIHLVEVPAPKAGKVSQTGFEHIEIVCDLTFAEMKATWPSCVFDDTGLRKLFNPELEIQLNGSAVKFHSLSLESVIRLEINRPVFSALTNSGILEILQPYHPVIAGTFPLGISVQESDLDIILDSSDLPSLEQFLRHSFGHFPHYASHTMRLEGIESLISKFEFESIPFELFAQNIPSVRQRAYCHFQIEERLLALGGDEFRKRVLECRSKGLKTEPAFSKVLGLEGDPFEALLELRYKTDCELDVMINSSLVI